MQLSQNISSQRREGQCLPLNSHSSACGSQRGAESPKCKGATVRRVLHNPSLELGVHVGSHWLLLLLFKLGSLRSSCALDPDVLPLQEQNSLVQPLLLPSCELLNKNYIHLHVFQNRSYWIKKLTLSSFSSSSVTSPSTSSKAALHGYKMFFFRTLYKNTLRLGGRGSNILI